MTPESDLRKPGFTEGLRVRLGDGQEWSFPRPVLRLLTPQRQPDGTFKMREGQWGADFQKGINELMDIQGETGEFDYIEYLSLWVTVAVMLLSVNYDLPEEMIPILFTLDHTTEESKVRSRDMVSEVNRVMLGFERDDPEKKHSPDGSDSPSGSTE